MKRLFAAGLVVSTLVLGCGSPAKDPAWGLNRMPDPSDPWILSSRIQRNSDSTPMMNAQIGFRVNADGSGMNQPCYLSDAYDSKGKLVRQPSPIDARWYLSDLDDEPSAQREGPYVQYLDLRNGTMITERVRTFISNHDVEIRTRIETVLHPTKRVIAQRWTLESAEFIGLQFSDPIAPADFRSGQTVVKFGVGGRRARLFYPIPAKQTQTGPRFPQQFERVISIGDAEGSDPPATPRFDEVQADAEKVWKSRWKTDIVIDGPRADQQAIHSFLYFLHCGLGGFVPPFGLSNDKYNGRMFWDADTWIFPAMAFVSPKEAAKIPQFRIDTLPEARKNAQRWIAAGRPIWIEKNGELEGILSPETAAGLMAKYPWEAGPHGGELAPQRMTFEEHISADVAFGVALAADLGLVETEASLRVGKAVTNYFRARTEIQNGRRVMRGLVGPDEYSDVDNDLFTNASVQALFKRFGTPADLQIPMHYPHDANGLLNFDHDTTRGAKQVSGLLAIFPLQDETAESQRGQMLERLGKAERLGPAMSESVIATILARGGQADDAYEHWQQSFAPYREAHPMGLFAESSHGGDTVFLTGIAGCLQTVIYGFLGFRVDDQPMPGSKWSKILVGGRVLSVTPQLPTRWKSITFRNFSVLGARWSLTATKDEVRATQGEP